MATTEYTATTTRTQRGIRLAAERGDEFTHDGNGVYRVPGSRSVPYTVDLEQGFCSCPDYVERIAKGYGPEGITACKHMLAVEIVAAKDRCRRRKARKTADRSHRADSLKGVLADPEQLDKIAARLGV
jgi:predicted nucleic acid-binding Zn finger protein